VIFLRGIGLSFQGPRGDSSQSGPVSLANRHDMSTQNNRNESFRCKFREFVSSQNGRRYQPTQASGSVFRDQLSLGERVYEPPPRSAQGKLSFQVRHSSIVLDLWHNFPEQLFARACLLDCATGANAIRQQLDRECFGPESPYPSRASAYQCPRGSLTSISSAPSSRRTRYPSSERPS
jgi:hypothetical protein